jgi:hypothetical protein
MTRAVALLCLCVLGIGCASKSDSTIADESLLAPDYVQLPEFGVELRPPIGFELTFSEDGFRHPIDFASIKLSASPQLDTLDRSLGKRMFDDSSTQLIHEEEREIGGESAVYFHFENSLDDERYVNWLLIAGIGDQTIRASGLCEKDQEASYGAAIKASVFSLRAIQGHSSKEYASEARLEKDLVELPDYGIAIRPPVGLARSSGYDQLVTRDLKVLIVVTQGSKPFSDVQREYTADALRERGARIIERSETEVNGQPGVLVHFETNVREYDSLRWSLIFGSAEQTTMVTASCPKERQARYAASLKASLLSVCPATTDPTERLSFEITPSGPFKYSHRDGDTAIYTVKGFKPSSFSDPRFIVTPSEKDLQDVGRRFMTDAGISYSKHVRSPITQWHEEITVDGLEGFEAMARAGDRYSDTRITIYQLVLFTGDSPITLTGLVGTKSSDEYLPHFKEMARSFRRK